MAEDDLSTPLLADNETSSPLLTENDTSLPLSTENDTSSPLPTENDTSSPLPTENVTSSLSDIKIKAENTTTTNNNPLDVSKMDHGCIHYRRRCKIRAPCCNQIYSCRHCHNEATSAFTNPEERHEIVRHDIKQVICELCSTEQQAAQICIKCGVKMGEYFCDICKFYEDDISKEQFHCNECGICRIGGREKFFHCKKCGSCYTITLRDNHPCVENSMKNQCPICYEFLFDSIKSSSILKCGHTMHMECQDEMLKHNQYRCPICLKSVLDMATTWQRVDEEIEATAMPEEYRYEVSILCSDCNNTSKTAFHIFGHKCSHCKSYNTRRIGPINESMERQIEPEDILP